MVEEVALVAVQEALTSTGVSQPSAPRPPTFVRKDSPSPQKPIVRGPYGAKTLHLIRDNHGQQVAYFMDGEFNRRAMY